VDAPNGSSKAKVPGKACGAPNDSIAIFRAFSGKIATNLNEAGLALAVARQSPEFRVE
jgi:hypothetical protein